MAATKNGWYMRVCKTKTEVGRIHLWCGIGGDSGSHRDWRDWHSNEDSEFDFPDDLLNVSEIWVRGEGDPGGRNVYMCLCYRDHVVKHIDFDNGEEHEQHQDDTDDCDC